MYGLLLFKALPSQIQFGPEDSHLRRQETQRQYLYASAEGRRGEVLQRVKKHPGKWNGSSTTSVDRLFIPRVVEDALLCMYFSHVGYVMRRV